MIKTFIGGGGGGRGGGRRGHNSEKCLKWCGGWEVINESFKNILK